MNLDYFPDTYMSLYWPVRYWQFVSGIVGPVWYLIKDFEVEIKRIVDFEVER